MSGCTRRACGLQQPDDGGAQEVMGQAGEILRLGLWLAMLVAGWALQKGLCGAGWPEDCATDCDEQHAWGWSCLGLPWTPDKLGEAQGIQQLLVYGFFCGWLNSVGKPRRFAYLFSVTKLPPPTPSGLPSGGRGSAAAAAVAGARLSSANEFEPLLIVNEAAARRAAMYGLGWQQRWRIPWFPLVFWATSESARRRRFRPLGRTPLTGCGIVCPQSQSSRGSRCWTS